ncbi:hypothetical protein BU25DRAFT_414242 [Macroventuria anomochaeta]|uniref:Uncharacterized protein n=1 Tax=Macroventuria anomochaeta TaxID=301207 RepID=A0ACB6RNU7_9PLEO|nr:uncharacterized protein BU25DRAFT_414242 [Macroventuria anomochaeta]KAF2623478.1 hypothetical protein BU25DRAFT_414242 [Macroventuria anomochaeta]
MVYRGRPSAACFACRTRRIKCDTRKPGCSQCARIRIICPGYRDPLDELFRDESAAVTKRAQKSCKAPNNPKHNQTHISKPTHPATCSAGSPDKHETNLGLPMSFCAPGPSLSQSIENVALAHFMSSYIPGSNFVYLPDLYSLSGEGAALPATVHAVSLARLAWELGQSSLMGQANRAYANALTKTNVALSIPAVATSDAVLVSVLLLSLYETIVWSDAGTPDNWIKHTQGALALIQLRGKRQLNTLVGRQLFTQVANIICVDSLRSGTRLSPGLLELQNAALQYKDESPRFGMSSSTGELANLLADVTEGCLTPSEVIEATQRMEAKYIAIISNLPACWQYEEEALEEAHRGVYGKTVHHYASNRSAQFWNSYRMTRILLNGVMHGHLRYLRSPNSSLLAQAKRNARQMAADICASVPQFTNSEHFSIASAATLLWPLSTVRSSDLVGQDLREHAEGRLKFLGHELRIPQAEKVASCREVDALQDGLHMFYLS